MKKANVSHGFTSPRRGEFPGFKVITTPKPWFCHVSEWVLPPFWLVFATCRVVLHGLGPRSRPSLPSFQLADGDAHAPDPEISETKDAAAIREDLNTKRTPVDLNGFQPFSEDFNGLEGPNGTRNPWKHRISCRNRP